MNRYSEFSLYHRSTISICSKNNSMFMHIYIHTHTYWYKFIERAARATIARADDHKQQPHCPRADHWSSLVFSTVFYDKQPACATCLDCTNRPIHDNNQRWLSPFFLASLSLRRTLINLFCRFILTLYLHYYCKPAKWYTQLSLFSVFCVLR